MEDEILENTKSKARDLLMCSLCGGTLFDARCLPCAHSYCRRCLQAYIDSIEGSIRLGSFRCPTCYTLIGIPRGGVSEFPVDKRIGDIKERVVEEMHDILRKKFLARKGMSDVRGSSLDSSDTESQDSDTLSRQRRTGGSRESDPPMHQGKSSLFGRYDKSFTAVNSHEKTSDMSNDSSSRSRFDHPRPAYSSLREIHRRKAQDLLAAFRHPPDSSETDEFVSSRSTSRKSYYDASETSYQTAEKLFNSSSRFKTHHTEDVPDKFFSGNSRSSFSSSNSSKAGVESASSSASGYFDDKNSSFLRNHRGYESLREKSSRRTYLGEDSFSYFAGKAAREPKFQETQRTFGDLYVEETDTCSVPVVGSDSRLKTASEHFSSVSNPSCLNHARKDHAGDVKFTYFERTTETVVHTSDDFVNDRDEEISESMPTSQPQCRRNAHFTGRKKPSMGRTKNSGAYISPLTTAYEECFLIDELSSKEGVPSNGTRNGLGCPPDFKNTLTSKANQTADLISNLSYADSDMNERQTFSEVTDQKTKGSDKVPSENLNNSSSLEEEVEAMQEFDFLLEQSNEDDEIGHDIKRSDNSVLSINSAINKRNSQEPHPDQLSRSSRTTETPPLADAYRQSMYDAKVADSAVNADKLINENGFADNGFRASHKDDGNAPPENNVTIENSNGMEEFISRCTDPLPSTDLFGHDGKAEATGESISSLYKADDMKIHDDPNFFEACDNDDDDGDDDEDTLVNGRASSEEDNCFDQLPSLSTPVIDDNVTTAGRTRGSPRVKRRKKTVNEGTATLHHVSPEVYLMPTGVAILSQGSTVVADYGVGCLQYYADDGSPLHRIDGMKPFSIAVNSTNNQVIVGDRRRKTVLLFDECGCDVAQWDANMFKWICGIGILQSGELVILDREKSQIGIYKPNGQQVHTFGSYGSDDCQLCMAEFLVVDAMDRIVVSDSGNHCIKVFSVAGTLLQKFGSRGCGDGEMQWPKGICTDESNNIIVADARNSRVSMFSSDGSFVQHLVTNITMPYAVSYSNPNVAVTRYSVMGQSQFMFYSINNKS